MVIHITEKQLTVLIKKSVQESLKKEIMKMRAGLVSMVSDAEQRDIEEEYGEPSRRTVASHMFKV